MIAVGLILAFFFALSNSLHDFAQRLPLVEYQPNDLRAVDGGTSCMAGFEPVTKEGECHHAADALGYQYRGVYLIRHPNRLPYCWFGGASVVNFNINGDFGANRENSQGTLVCKRTISCADGTFDTDRVCAEIGEWCGEPEKCLDCSHCDDIDRSQGKCPECMTVEWAVECVVSDDCNDTEFCWGGKCEDTTDPNVCEYYNSLPTDDGWTWSCDYLYDDGNFMCDKPDCSTTVAPSNDPTISPTHSTTIPSFNEYQPNDLRAVDGGTSCMTGFEPVTAGSECFYASYVLGYEFGGVELMIDHPNRLPYCWFGGASVVYFNINGDFGDNRENSPGTLVCKRTIPFQLVFRQTIPYLYARNELRLNPENPSDDNYAILDELERYRSDNGRFYLRMVWPGDETFFEWSQTSNPVSEGIEGYEAISEPYIGQHWGGLEPSPLALMDGSVNHGNWFYAVGSHSLWRGGIPSYAKSDYDMLYPKQVVELYVATVTRAESSMTPTNQLLTTVASSSIVPTLSPTTTPTVDPSFAPTQNPTTFPTDLPNLQMTGSPAGYEGSICQADDDCNSERCNVGESPHRCREKEPHSGECKKDTDCQSEQCLGNNCVDGRENDRCNSNDDCNSGRCAFGFTFGKCQSLAEHGENCIRNSDCVSQHCLLFACTDHRDGAQCVNDDDCLEASSCIWSATTATCNEKYGCTWWNWNDCSERCTWFQKVTFTCY